MLRSLPVAFLLAAAVARAEPEMPVAPAGNPTFPEMPGFIPLWSGPAPGSEAQLAPETSHWEHFGTFWAPVVSGINVPSISPFLPTSPNGSAVIVCPGGGHRFLALEHEGYRVGTWLAEHGIAAFVLKYRLAKAPGSPYLVERDSLADAQRAIRFVRSRATGWKVDPHRVGIMGFSAGGEVAFLAGTRPPVRAPGPADTIDRQDCRPDFMALFYPGLPPPPYALGRGAPPTFLCAASDDGFKLAPPMVRLYLDLEAAGASVEMHVYAHGGHGFGIRDEAKPAYSWMPLFATWLAEDGGRG